MTLKAQSKQISVKALILHHFSISQIDNVRIIDLYFDLYLVLLIFKPSFVELLTYYYKIVA